MKNPITRMIAKVGIGCEPRASSISPGILRMRQSFLRQVKGSVDEKHFIRVRSDNFDGLRTPERLRIEASCTRMKQLSHVAQTDTTFNIQGRRRCMSGSTGILRMDLLDVSTQSDDGARGEQFSNGLEISPSHVRLGAQTWAVQQIKSVGIGRAASGAGIIVCGFLFLALCWFFLVTLADGEGGLSLFLPYWPLGVAMVVTPLGTASTVRRYG